MPHNRKADDGKSPVTRRYPPPGPQNFAGRNSERETPMPPIPRDKSLDSTRPLIWDSYRFIKKRCQRYAADLFETRLGCRGPST